MNAMIRVMLASVGALLLVQATAAADEAIGKKASVEKGEVEAGCVISTGSRILAQRSKCTALGRSYSQRDVRVTGATTAADALRLLDPAISVHR